MFSHLERDLDHAHQTGIEPQQVDGSARSCRDLFEDLGQLKIVQEIIGGVVVADPPGPCIIGSARGEERSPRSGSESSSLLFVDSAAVIPQHRANTLSGVRFDTPGKEVGGDLGVARVGLPHLLDLIFAEGASFGEEVPTRFLVLEPVDLSDNRDFAGGSDLLHLGQVPLGVLFQVVVPCHPNQERPLSLRQGRPPFGRLRKTRTEGGAQPSSPEALPSRCSDGIRSVQPSVYLAEQTEYVIVPAS